jgi:hypothetical protein
MVINHWDDRLLQCTVAFQMRHKPGWNGLTPNQPCGFTASPGNGRGRQTAARHFCCRQKLLGRKAQLASARRRHPIYGRTSAVASQVAPFGGGCQAAKRRTSSILSHPAFHHVQKPRTGPGQTVRHPGRRSQTGRDPSGCTCGRRFRANAACPLDREPLRPARSDQTCRSVGLRAKTEMPIGGCQSTPWPAPATRRVTPLPAMGTTPCEPTDR